MTPEDAAVRLRLARTAGTTLAPFTDEAPGLDEAWGYATQDADRAARLAVGERTVGAKLGLTSIAKQQRMNLHRPIFGFLTDAMVMDVDGVADALPQWAQPRIEPEIAFVTAHPMDRALDDDEVPRVVASVLVAAEIIDSRWSDYRFRLADVIADNTSAAGLLLGARPIPLAEAGDLSTLSCEVVVDDEVVHRATGAAVLDQPLRALRRLSEHLAARGETLPAGSLVLGGALTDAVPLVVGRTYRLSVERLGAVCVDLGARG